MSLEDTRKTVTFCTWDESATGSWDIDTGLHTLRDESPVQLAEFFVEMGDYHVQNTAIAEIMAHGNPRKAGELCRELVKRDKELADVIKQTFGPEVTKYLLEEILVNMPSNPSEYPPDIRPAYKQ